MQEGTIRLLDGRLLGYAEYGAPQGTPVLFFHGTPGSRKMRHPQNELAESVNVRLIAADRPGYGLSDFQPNRSFLDWPEDVSQLADQLEIDKFRVVAFSGGGPYALACAYTLQSRVQAVALMSSMGPLNSCASNLGIWPVQFAIGAAHRAPWLLKRVTDHIVARARKDFDRCFEWFVSKLPECDQDLMLRPEIRAIFRESLTEAFRNGSTAFLWELKLLRRSWEFPLQEIRQPIVLWHGDQDPFSNGRSLAALLPSCRTTFLPEGHLVFFSHWLEILHQLIPPGK